MRHRVTTGHFFYPRSSGYLIQPTVVNIVLDGQTWHGIFVGMGCKKLPVGPRQGVSIVGKLNRKNGRVQNGAGHKTPAQNGLDAKVCSSSVPAGLSASSMLRDKTASGAARRRPAVSVSVSRVRAGGRLEKLEKMVQYFCEKGPNAISLDEIIDQVNLAKFHLASAHGAESGGT